MFDLLLSCRLCPDAIIDVVLSFFNRVDSSSLALSIVQYIDFFDFLSPIFMLFALFSEIG